MNIIKTEYPNRQNLEKITESVKGNFKSSLDFLYFRKVILHKFNLNPNTILYIAYEDDIIVGFAFLNFLEWDTKIFGFKIGRIEHLVIKNMKMSFRKFFLKRIIYDCKVKRYKHIHCRIGLKDFKTLKLLESLKFHIADIQCTLRTAENFKIAHYKLPNGISLHSARQTDCIAMKDILRNIFTETRFMNDGNYSRDSVNKMYFEWLKNAVKDKKKQVFIIKTKGVDRIIAFCICCLDKIAKETFGDNIGYIDLIAIDKYYRNKGLGKTLIKCALKWFSARANSVEIRTQISNIAAIKCFMNGGFREFTYGISLPAGISLHRWF